MSCALTSTNAPAGGVMTPPHREPHAIRLPDNAIAVETIDPQHEAVGLLTLLAQLNKTGERNAIGRIAQNRMVDQRGLQRGDSKAGGNGQESKADNETDRTMAKQHSDDDGGNCGR